MSKWLPWKSWEEFGRYIFWLLVLYIAAATAAAVGVVAAAYIYSLVK
jgi:hypothetical protein